MPTERELLALCLRWIQNPQGDAFDKAMLIEAVQAKLQPRPWVGLTDEGINRLWSQSLADTEGETYLPLREFARAIEAELKEKNQ